MRTESQLPQWLEVRLLMYLCMYMLPKSSHISSLTLLSVPSAPPTFVSTSVVTSSSITVQWGAVDCIHRNGDITDYSVRYGVQGSGSTQTESVSGGATTEATISGLESATNYTIEVAAENSAGTGVYSGPITALTSGNLLYITQHVVTL